MRAENVRAHTRQRGLRLLLIRPHVRIRRDERVGRWIEPTLRHRPPFHGEVEESDEQEFLDRLGTADEYVEMSPERFLALAIGRSGRRRPRELIAGLERRINTPKFEAARKRLARGDPVDAPALFFRDNPRDPAYSNGFNRAYAAYYLGIKKIPVEIYRRSEWE